MKNSNHESERQVHSILWQTQPKPAPCEHQNIVLAHDEGDLKRCLKCGRLEAE